MQNIKYKNIFSKGFTLIETIVTIAIFTLAFAAVSAFILYSYRSQSYVIQQLQSIENARRGVETMVREIREAGPGDDGSYSIEKAGDFEFIFYSDIDKDEAQERVRYFLEDSVLKKGVTEPSGKPLEYSADSEKISVLSKYVQNGTPVFVYYNGDWPEDTVNNPLPASARLSETKLMCVQLKIDIDPNQLPDSFELVSYVQIRNLKTNL